MAGSSWLAADIGASKIVAARVTVEGLVATERIELSNLEYDSWLREVIALLRRLQQPETRGLLVGCAGQIDEHGALLHSPNHAFRDRPLREDLIQRLQIPVRLENDVNAALMGEAWCGAAQGCGSAVAIYIGTGVGGAALEQGRLIRGARGGALELGHLPFRPGRICGCGLDGCVEAWLGGRSLERAAARHDPSGLRASEVFACAHNGLPWASQLVLEAAAALRYCLAVVLTTFCPERIVLGGGLFARIEALEPGWAEVQFDAARARTTMAARVASQLVRARLGEQAILLAAPRLLGADVDPPALQASGTAENPSR